LIDKDIAGFDIAMNDSSGVGSIERIRDLNSKVQDRSLLKGLPAISCVNVLPARNCMARNGAPSCHPNSYTVQILG
jgi:hypothetical protein